MLFNSPLFLFAFLPALYAAYWASAQRFRNALLLAASLLFYSWGEPRFVFLAAASALADYGLGKWVTSSDRVASPRGVPSARSDRFRRAALTVAILQNLGLLAYFKYANFFVENVNLALAGLHLGPLPLASLVLPLAISFIVFEKITYVVDLYRGTGRPARNVWDYLLYVFFFPKLLAGPIIKYHEIADQIESRGRPAEADVAAGVVRFIVGLGKKLLIADAVAPVADRVFALPAGRVDAPLAWLGALAFAVQIYFDFSGYSDMAIGLARTFGFRLRENFRRPYLATSFTDFWRRWHISLSTWIREYLYVPLGGNRRGTARTYLNLWTCFVLSGLWHGAQWTFVAWGVYHGAFLVLDRLVWLRAEARIPAVAARGLTFLLLLVSWVIFRSTDLAHAAGHAAAMAGIGGSDPAFVEIGREPLAALVVGLVLALCPRPRSAETVWTADPPRYTLRLVGSCLLLCLCVLRVSNSSFHPFLYFRF